MLESEESGQCSLRASTVSNARLLLSAFEIRSPLLLGPLIRHLDIAGFERFWTTEHHSERQSASPTIVAGIAGCLSSRLKVGTLGLKLRHYSPLRVAKDFHLLQMLFPGRIDVGVIDGAYGDRDLSDHLNAGRDGLSFSERVAELVGYLREPSATPLGHGIARSDQPPRIWIGSSSAAGAEAAASLGVGFACHPGISRSTGLEGARAIITRYRERFVPNRWLQSPQVVVVAFGCCVGLGEEPLEQWRKANPISASTVSVAEILSTGGFCATSNEIREQLECTAGLLNADEIAVQCFADSPAAVLRSYSIIADAFGLARTETPLASAQVAVPE